MGIFKVMTIIKFSFSVAVKYSKIFTFFFVERMF